ncbi:hypothetical protein COS33_01535 [Candidatus Wolfebacteria bacterium CG02_land_8_20_14_3_00_37_12]|uniref:Uncharacterized protein n=1 Tax=Candidatus Wolfebacteria bacterium CG02_land_8_20_14_3_00_37_12 TaxID=1975066 RepID=A0A2M7CQ04_9BACT|nr:MAG: hypothetical protein COS33_01535 [Candidatus Wolfebacteria bacterium CG02_land_8_20_14_3_00_37_12]
MNTITIPKNEYSKLRRQSDAYKKLSSRFFEFMIKDPIEEVINDFRKTNLYTKGFLADLEDGLKKSSYAKK